MDEEMKVKTAPLCPYCNTKMKKTMTPPFNYGDGLGWCVPYLYICFNEDCRLYVNGWTNILNNYGKHASYRCMCYPDSGNMDSVMVLSSDAYKGQIVEE